jgi:hypothetical protein
MSSGCSVRSWFRSVPRGVGPRTTRMIRRRRRRTPAPASTGRCRKNISANGRLRECIHRSCLRSSGCPQPRRPGPAGVHIAIQAGGFAAESRGLDRPDTTRCSGRSSRSAQDVVVEKLDPDPNRRLASGAAQEGAGLPTQRRHPPQAVPPRDVRLRGREAWPGSLRCVGVRVLGGWRMGTRGGR